MRAFPEKKLAPKMLSHIYKKHKIRKKKIKITKILGDVEHRKIRFQVPEVREALQAAIDDGFHVIFVDEMMVTKSTIPTHDYSQKNSQIRIDYKQYAKETIAVLAGVSAEMGLDLVMTFQKSVNITKFKTYLEELRRKDFFDDLCLYFDNLSVHRSKDVKERLEELGIRYIFAPVYSPDFNPTEFVFSIVKREIKKERLKAILHEKSIDLNKVVHEKFNGVNILSIVNCI